ncbi:hypothetical protein ACU8KH_05137 [Lachancea thermotolerans]
MVISGSNRCDFVGITTNCTARQDANKQGNYCTKTHRLASSKNSEFGKAPNWSPRSLLYHRANLGALCGTQSAAAPKAKRTRPTTTEFAKMKFNKIRSI